ncbi:unnamed protein product [Angiostrongylus costaricensis]|uniref:Uncharacterized protein n=1 Tax=Angiostrongylus costaricensis TaxID=334426 RepID=A0A0R3PUT0_ANGCS|nr:unnamed protein product [Angiostrongylus costaricensis]
MERFSLLILILFVLLDPVITEELVKTDTQEKRCKVYRMPPVHHVMDQICLLCHEMFSHEAPNLRAQCRANCFRNDWFSSCIAMFSSKNRQDREQPQMTVR